MKFKNSILALFASVILLLVGCEERNAVERPRHTEPVLTAKIVALKSERVEQRLSFDIFDNQTIRTRAKTIYYIVAEDGTGVEVRLSEFARAKVGEPWKAQYWHNVD